MTHTTRRALLGAAAIAPAALAGSPVSAITPHDPRWRTLVADYHAKREAWLATIGGEDDAQPAYQAALPPEPQKPGTGLPADISSMTIAEIRAVSDDPAYKATWDAYERDHAAWAQERDATADRFLGSAKRRRDEAYAAYDKALVAVTDYRAPSLAGLAEKIEIVSADYYGADIPQEYIAEILADVRHLGGETRS